MRGLFIVLDGLSGAGKGTQLRHLSRFFVEELRASHVLLTREPTDSHFGKEAQALRKRDKEAGVPTSVHAAQYAELYARDTAEHSSKVIAPALACGVHVLCDRYYHSRFAYQAHQGVAHEELLRLHQAYPLAVPDLTLIMLLPTAAALERIDRRGQGRSGMENAAIMEDLLERFSRVPGIFPGERIRIIDAARSENEVTAAILVELQALMGTRQT